MKSLYLLITLSLAILARAMPTVSNRALRIRLQHRSLSLVDPMSVQSNTNERFMGAQRAERLISYAHEKYTNTLAAYERNTGSRHPLDTLPRSPSNNPSKRANNGSVALDNYQASMWYGALAVGTPPQYFTVDFDTGSSDTWVPTKGCPDNCYGHRTYDASKSSTSRDLVFPFIDVLVYGSGVALVTTYKDKVGVGGYTFNQVVGGAWFWSEYAVDGFASDGLSGFGFPEISALDVPPVMQNLNESCQLPRRCFSFKLSTTPGQSELIVGDADYAAYKNNTLVSVPVTQPGYWQVKMGGISLRNHTVPESIDQAAIVDTGTTLIMTPPAIADSYFSGIPGAKSTPLGAYTVYTVPCTNIASTTPTLTFEGRGFPVSADAWNFGPIEPGSTDCMVGMASSNFDFTIIGDVFLRNVYSIFDFSYPPSVQFAELV